MSHHSKNCNEIKLLKIDKILIKYWYLPEMKLFSEDEGSDPSHGFRSGGSKWREMWIFGTGKELLRLRGASRALISSATSWSLIIPKQISYYFSSSNKCLHC